MSEGERERIKLGANWCNTVSAGLLLVGALAPAMQALSGSVPFSFYSLLAVISNLVTSVFGHIMARSILRGLD